MPPVLHRPEPLLEVAPRPVDRGTPPARAAAALRDGDRLQVTDHFRTGVEILAALDALLPAPPLSDPFVERQAHARAHRRVAMGLLAPVRDHRVDLHGAPPPGFLPELYPDLAHFLLPLVQLQELAGAWRRYEEGLHLSVLGHRIHPYYGTYAPTRTEHLELFATWLSQHQGARDRVVDVGTGCGVLALLLARAGCTDVQATDQNPNAIESLRRELARLEAPVRVQPLLGDLLQGTVGPLDLVVFNPPWIRGEADSLVQQALVYEPGLFERFFDQATERLAPQGRLVLLFSNMLDLVRPDLPHPIERELARQRLRLVQKLHRRVKSQGRRTREKVEVWELALA